MKHPDSIQKLIHQFSLLPSVGQKTAARYAYFFVDQPQDFCDQFCQAMQQAKQNIRFCKTCFCFCEGEECYFCTTRDAGTICVVAYPKDVSVIEKAGFKGAYHVLGGTLSPLDGRGPDELRIKQLLIRLSGTQEVIMATNPDVEGEATAIYLARLLTPMGIKVTRLAEGISMGSEIEYADEATLSKALAQRTDI